MQSINPAILCTAMAHPSKRAIIKLRSKKGIHLQFSFRDTHVRCNSFSLAFLSIFSKRQLKLRLALTVTPKSFSLLLFLLYSLLP